MPADVRAIEAADEKARASQGQALDDLAPGAFVGRRRQRDARHAGEAFRQHRELQVLGPEVVAPLRHAVGLVDGDERQGHAGQQVEGAVEHQTLRRQVQQVEPAGPQPGLDLARLVGPQRRVQEGGAHAGLTQRRHLVLHERDERRHHEPRAGPHQRRHLVAQRLAAAGGHEDHGIAAGDEMRHHLVLGRAEGLVAEDRAEDVVGRVGCSHVLSVLPGSPRRGAAGRGADGTVRRGLWQSGFPCRDGRNARAPRQPPETRP
jgi:hypothetical protein